MLYMELQAIHASTDLPFEIIFDLQIKHSFILFMILTSNICVDRVYITEVPLPSTSYGPYLYSVLGKWLCKYKTNHMQSLALGNRQ